MVSFFQTMGLYGGTSFVMVIGIVMFTIWSLFYELIIKDWIEEKRKKKVVRGNQNDN